MRKLIVILPLAAALAACPSAYPAYEVLDPAAYNVFVAPWEPAEKPLCAVLQSAADWDATMRPAAVMGENVFGPPATLWTDQAVLLMARETNPGDPSKIFTVKSLTRSTGANAMDLEIAYVEPPAGTYTMVSYIAVAVPKPLPHVVHITQNGTAICEVRPGG